MKAVAASVERALRGRERQLWWTAAVTGLAVLGLFTVYLWSAWRDIEGAALAEQQLYVRVLEAQASATLGNIGSVLRVASEAVEARAGQPDSGRMTAALTDAISGQAALRSLSVLDAQAKVVASTNPDNVGHQVDIARLGGLPADRMDVLGPWLPVRDLMEMDVGRTASQGPGAIPVLRRLQLPGQQVLLLAAVVNPDHFATQGQLLIGKGADRSAVLSFGGQLLLHGLDVPLHNGSSPSNLTPFVRYLPAREHASYVDRGMDGKPSVGAFRTLRNWPVVVIAERPYAEVWAELWNRARWAATAVVTVWVLMGVMFALLRRGLVAQRRAQGQLAALHAEVAKSEERSKLALEGAGDAVWDWDIARAAVNCSPRWGVMLGYAGQELNRTFLDWLALIHRDDIVRVRQALEAHLCNTSQHLYSELRMRCGDGSWKWLLMRGMAAPERDPNNRPSRLIGTLTDISERRAAELALAASQARRVAVLQSALDAIVTVDVEGRVIDFNPAAEKMFQRSFDSVANRRIYDLLVAPGERDPLLQRMAAYRATGKASTMNRRLEVSAVRADGSVFPIELTVVPVRAGGAELFTATMRDISERKWAERALRDSEARARATFEQAAVGVLQQGQDRRFLRVNQTLCRMLGYTMEEFLALHPDQLIHPDDVMKGLAGMERLFRGELTSFAEEKRYRRKNGQYLWIRLTASLARDDDGQVQYMIGIVEDIEVERRTQEALKAARRREVQIGAHIQQSLLVTTPNIEIPGVWLSSYNQASQEIDGDFFEVICPAARCVDFIAGDVMGKGVNAALMGAAVKMQFNRSMVELTTASSRRGKIPQPAEILDAVHRAMTPHLQTLEAFVTLCYLRLDLDRGMLSWVGCGHEEAMLVHGNGASSLLRNQQPPLGVLTETLFVQEEIAIQDGDMLLMHSDGVTDAIDADGRRVGSERVQQVFSRLATSLDMPAAMLHLLRRELLSSSTLTDDVTIVMAKICEPDTLKHRVELKAAAASIGQLRTLVRKTTSAARLGEVDAGLFEVAVIEAFTNIFRHGVGLFDGAPVEVTVQCSATELFVELAYIGEPYDPPAEISETNFDEYPEGGFGLTIINRACDRVDYGHRCGVNTMRMSRWIDAAGVAAAV